MRDRPLNVRFKILTACVTFPPDPMMVETLTVGHGCNGTWHGGLPLQDIRDFGAWITTSPIALLNIFCGRRNHTFHAQYLRAAASFICFL